MAIEEIAAHKNMRWSISTNDAGSYWVDREAAGMDMSTLADNCEDLVDTNGLVKTKFEMAASDPSSTIDSILLVSNRSVRTQVAAKE